MQPEFIFSLVVLIISIIIHEISHGYVALWLGDSTAKYAGRLTFNPIPHIDLVGSIILPLLTAPFGVVFGWAKPVPVNPYNLRGGARGEALVAVAGPLANIFLALLFSLLLRLTSADFLPLPQTFISLASLVVLVNLVLAVFNLMPVPPLDGSKILFAFLPSGFEPLRERLERLWFVWVFLFVFVVWQFLLPVVGAIFLVLTGVAF